MSTDTKKHITALKNFLGNEINSILEIQCGEGYNIENCTALQDKNMHYIGADVVDEVIQDNRQYFREEKNKLFMILDASNEPLPKVDLIVCCGMAEYLPIPNIWSLLENIRDSQAKYVAFDYYHSAIDNMEINEEINLSDSSEEEETTTKTKRKAKKSKSIPQKRAINLTLKPFYFPTPSFLVPTDDVNRSVALYKISDIYFYMDWHNDDISKLRSDMVSYLKTDFDKLLFAFKDHMDMLIPAMLEPLDWNKFYYNDKYKNFVDTSGVFNEYVLLLLLMGRSDLNRINNEKANSYGSLINEENFTQASVIAKDYVRWRLTGSLFG